MTNRLARESSPYLLQHQDNPVDWYPWGEEALGKARAEDKPILLSVGYSACHWCHVMEHESFADEETARIMNEHFVNVKVDREERPDVDALYMQAVQQMTGHGGWPMTVFLTPDGRPFYGGTYFPPEPRHGLPSFRQVLQGVSHAYTERREEVDGSAAQLQEALRKGMEVNPEPSAVDASLLTQAFHRMGSRFDARYGGFGDAPKFPQPMTLEFLLRHAARTGSPEALRMVEQTLDAMARGGVYDQLGGGFHRYSVDARWLVPHFEKMLYDNALLGGTYLRAYQLTGRQDFRRTAVEVLDYAIREMLGPEGGFYSSQDADSEGEEGRFYVWSAAEIEEVLGSEDAEIFGRFYGVSDAGNWEGHNILHLPRPREELMREIGLEEERLEAVLADARRRLYDARSARVWPGRDDKVLASWNAMMLHTLSAAARILDDPRFREIAVANAEFLLGELRVGDRLLRSWRDGVARIDGFLEDYALLLDALLELYAATFDPRWVREADWLADRMLERFWAPDEEAFFDTPADGESLVVRPRDLYDNATPSGNSAAAFGLIRLARLTGSPERERVASRVVQGLGGFAAQVPQAFGHLLCALDHHLAPPTEVALVGSTEAPDTTALVGVLRQRFLPNTTVALLDPARAEDGIDELIPLLAERTPLDGRAAAYVCRHYTCRRPVATAEELAAELAEVTSAAAPEGEGP